MFISSSGMPERVTCKISGRYVPISPTYDRNEFDQIYNKETHQNAFFEFVSKFHQILNFFIAKLLSKLKIYTNSKKKFEFGKKQQKKKANFFFEESNYLTKKSTNWTLRLLSWPIRANSVFYSITFPPSLFLFSSCFASAGCLRVPHMGRLNNRGVRFSIFYSIAFPPSLLLFSSC